jgi:metal-responsive CopG/Arc/MetJ family transcriptional regulator
MEDQSTMDKKDALTPICIKLQPALLEEVDRFISSLNSPWRGHPPTRSEAVRRLIRQGLDTLKAATTQ